MKQLLSYRLSGMLMAGALVLAGPVSPAFAQSDNPPPRVPLPLERPATVYNQTMTEPLNGEGEGSLVHVLSYNGGIYPPAPDGSPNPANTILFTTRVGAGVDPLEMPGSFVTAIIPRPVEPFFVRVYNAPTLEASTFYEDSDIHTPSISADVAFYPAMTATTNAIDSADDNSDGINNSWARSLGLSTTAIGGDTDGDTWSDWHELAMGTDPKNPDKFIADIAMNMMNGKVVADWVLPDHDALQVLNALNIPPATREDLDQMFSGMPFALESSRLVGHWTNAMSGEVSVSDQGNWPPEMPMVDGTNTVQFYRLRVYP